MPTLHEQLEAEFDLNDGFLGRLRQGTFDAESGNRFLELLEGIDLSQSGTIDKRLVSLLWMIPLLMQWQYERVAEGGGDVPALQQLQIRVIAILESPKVLGVP